jgi:hypothetical protein
MTEHRLWAKTARIVVTVLLAAALLAGLYALFTNM